jgi:FkbM family methyltransferase
MLHGSRAAWNAQAAGLRALRMLLLSLLSPLLLLSSEGGASLGRADSSIDKPPGWDPAKAGTQQEHPLQHGTRVPRTAQGSAWTGPPPRPAAKQPSPPGLLPLAATPAPPAAQSSQEPERIKNLQSTSLPAAGKAAVKSMLQGALSTDIQGALSEHPGTVVRPSLVPVTQCDPAKERLKVANSWESSNVKATNCPNNDAWLNAFANDAATSGPITIIVFGCNKGIDAVRVFSQYDMRPRPFQLQAWKQALHKHIGQEKGSCGQVASAGELSKPTSNSPTVPNVYCIEPLPSNYKMLRKLASETSIPKSFHILQFVLGVSQRPAQVDFPDAEAGYEAAGLQHVDATANKANPKIKTSMVKVDSTTVDALFSKLPGSIDMLLVDTEGHDPLALLGAAKTLQVVRYLEFENHNTGEWKTFKLRTIIDFLDNLDFDCWWTTNGGRLARITGCWHPHYADWKVWSNIACAKRKDSWWAVMQRLWQAEG